MKKTNESIFQWFPKRCEELGVQIVDYQYYINECDKYELFSTQDVHLMFFEILNRLTRTGEDFKVSFKNTEDTHIILLYDPVD